MSTEGGNSCDCQPGKGALQLAIDLGKECDYLIENALMTPAAKQRLMDVLLDWGKPRRVGASTRREE